MNKKETSRFQTLKKLASYMGNHTTAFVIIGLLVAVSAIASLLGTYMIRPVVNLAVEGNVKKITTALITCALIYTAGVLAAWGYTRMMARSAQEVSEEIRHDLFAKMEKMPLKVFDTTKAGDIMSRFTADLDTVTDALNNSFSVFVQSFIQAAGTLIMLFILNWKLSLIVAVFYAIMIAYIILTSRRSRRYFSFQQTRLGALNGLLEEVIAGLKTVKVFRHEKANLEEFRKENGVLQKSSRKALNYAQSMVPVVVSSSYLNYAIVSVLGGYMVFNGEMDVGSLASYLVFVRQAAMPINQFVSQSIFLLSALSGAKRIFDFMDIPAEPDEGKVTLAYGKEENGQWTQSDVPTGKWIWKHPRENGEFEYVPLKGAVEFHHVDFGYVPEKQVLSDFSVWARPGQTIAFVGSTGAGKTTITNLLNRFYEIQGGSVTYDGIDVRLIKKDDLRKAMVMVLQDTHLFSGTIMENIRFGRLNASDEEVIEAAKLANAHSFIRRLPQGYQTVITTDGGSLSAGQRQLLSIARAAVASPPVLILDEATSSIDTRTEKLIEKGMEKLMEGRTTFVIAHRLSTVRDADCIVVLEKGEIVEKGTHEELLEKGGWYSQLYNGMIELD